MQAHTSDKYVTVHGSYKTPADYPTMQLADLVSRLCSDAPTDVVTEVLEILSRMCKDPSIMRRTKRVNNNAPAGTIALDLIQAKTEADEAMVDTPDDT
jgi:hypothetical protein